MGTKIDNLKRWVGIEPGGKWKVNPKESKRDQTKLHWSYKSPKYRVRTIGIHNPTKGIVYRKTRIKRSTFQDPEWRKANPQLHKQFSGPIPKKKVPTDIYSPAMRSKKELAKITSSKEYKGRHNYNWK